MFLTGWNGGWGTMDVASLYIGLCRMEEAVGVIVDLAFKFDAKGETGEFSKEKIFKLRPRESKVASA